MIDIARRSDYDYDYDINAMEKLSQETGIELFIIKLLWLRGMNTAEKISHFYNDGIDDLLPPSLLENTEEVAEIIKNTVADGDGIVIYGDYDCDGIGGIAILYETISALGGNVNYYIPSRHEEGYGLNTNALDVIKTQYNPKLIVTVDCGITAAKEVEYARKLGIKVLVTDHHYAVSTIPNCLIVNPNFSDYPYPLCGCGVAFKLAEALTDKAFAMQFLDICAISTIADVVPLVGENRILSKLGLEVLTQRQCRVGLLALIEAAGLKHNNYIRAGDVGFKLAPRLNASGRLKTARKSLELLLTDNPATAKSIAKELNEDNKLRQDLCTMVIEDAMTRLKSYDFSRNRVIVLASSTWEEGVIGIAAAKIAERFNRPTILLVDNGESLKGSGRSIKDVNLLEMLTYCDECLTRYGGHAAAAGLVIEPEYLDEFCDLANEYLFTHFSQNCFRKRIIFDVVFSPENFTEEIADKFKAMQPFGAGNPKPLMLMRRTNISFDDAVSTYPHLVDRLYRLSIWGFNMRDYKIFFTNDSEKYTSYTLEDDNWHENEWGKCILRDVVPIDAHFNSTELLIRYMEYYLYKETNAVKPAKLSIEEENLLDGVNLFDGNEVEAENNKPRPDKTSEFGTAYIAFTQKVYDKFVLEHRFDPIEKCVFKPLSPNPCNMIVLAPNKEFPYAYFNELIFLEQPPEKLLRFIRRSGFTGAIDILHDNVGFLKIFDYTTEDAMRYTFCYMQNYLFKIRYDELWNMYRTVVEYGYKYEYYVFAISYYVFLELELLSFAENGKLYKSKDSVRIEDSEIMKMLHNLKFAP